MCAEYIAMYTYESSEQGDLSFQQGDIVTVTRKEGDWWTGMVGGKTGVFPSNYVKPRDSSTEVRRSWETKKDKDFREILKQLGIIVYFILNVICVSSLWDQQGRRAAWGRNLVSSVAVQ